MGAVSLVCMPWHALAAPSIQLGTLQAVLQRAGIPARTHSLHLQLMSFLGRGGPEGRALLGPDDYREIGDRWFMLAPGEWVFAQPPIRVPDRAEDRRYLARLRREGVSRRLLKRLPLLRERIPDFLDECATEILETGAEVVGFTTTFGQTVASLALAARLKERDPDVRTVFGGANCEGPMGEALHRSFDCIDVVVRGEGEPVLPELVECLAAGRPVPALPGLCYRDGGRSVVVPERCGSAVSMDDVPRPDYGEYFERLERLRMAAEIRPVLPFESSRGCWWGQKSHCTFCGMNGQSMTHRSKSPGVVVSDLMALAREHDTLDFTLVDNIMDLGYFKTVLPELRDTGSDLRLFYQTKANLSLDQVRLLRDSGVRRVRPGIESLSTPILALMRKGVTALQNIRILKWCARYDIHVAWNVIYGLPGEPAEEYARMARIVPSLVHLSPPHLVRLTLDRFSPYYTRPEDHGVRLLGAPQHYRSLYGLDENTLAELAWTFDYSIDGGRTPETYVNELQQQITRWRADMHGNRGALTYRLGPSFMIVDDARTTVGVRRFVLDDLESRVYLACDAGGAAETIASELTAATGRTVEGSRVQDALDRFESERLVYAENGRYLSLAIPEDSLVCEPAR